MNYYQIHKNKKPKRIPERRLNPKRAHLTIIMAMSTVQISIIKSNVFKNPVQKALEVASCVLDTASAIQKLFSKKQKYLDRIKKQRNGFKRNKKGSL